MKDFQRNSLLEQLLTEINNKMQIAEKEYLLEYSGKTIDYPIIFIMGALRSGTTLLMQWLANTGIVAYPTNLLSRFYKAPILGAKIQLMLTNPSYNFRNEFLNPMNSGISGDNMYRIVTEIYGIMMNSGNQ